MNFFTRFLLLAAITAGAALPNPVLAESILFESGTLGATGVTWDDVHGEIVPSTRTDHIAFSGVRFELTETVVTTQIGGHFVAPVAASFFGALVELDDENDFPNSGDLSTSDVLGATLLDFPVSSDEVFGDLALVLDAGWYALVFGSGLFDATAFGGGTVRNGLDLGDPTYFGHLQSTDWFNLGGFQLPFDNNRFVVIGNTIPEPSTTILVVCTLLFSSMRLAKAYRYR